MYTTPAMSRPATPHAVLNSLENPTTSQSSQSRLMQVKVLYTFDDNNKTNCLARCSQPLHIRTAYLEPSAEIGIIELRTCVQTIVAASPELIAKLGQDYTVYAYDYSEYETPLVGQGMLSWVLASASTTPMAPAQQSRTMVTGRVCKNILGLFSDGVKETLEVKLRLIPVPTCLQSEYLASMEKYRDASCLASVGIDGDAWTTFLRANPGFSISEFDVDVPPASRNQPANPTYQRNGFQTVSDSARSEALENVCHSTSEEVLRLPDPTAVLVPGRTENPDAAMSRSTIPLAQTEGKHNAPSRPSSRASNRGSQAFRPRGASRAASFQGQDASGLEEGPCRKRARTMKTDWSGPASFGSNTDSLRVTASVAASIRGHDIIRSHPTASEIAAGDFGVRPPTPRPVPLLRRKQSGITHRATSLSHDTLAFRSDDYVSPYPPNFYGSVLTSPEGQNGSAGSTPQDIPSSPPVPRNRSISPSSPALPRYANPHDSGFMSGALDECSGDDDEVVRPAIKNKYTDEQPGKKGFQILASELSITEEIPGDPNLLPRRIQPRRASAKRRPSAVPRRNPRPETSDIASPKSACLPVPILLTQERSEIDEDTSEPDKRDINDGEDNQLSNGPCLNNQNFPGSESCMSDSALPLNQLNGEGRSNATKRNPGSSMKRKKAIQERLVSSIAAGQMPPFCRNCGEISTPTWRKAFVKVECGSPDALQFPDNDDGFVTYEPVVKSVDGTVTSYRIIKKVIGPEEKDFEEVQLCNPCGIWLFKWRTMRPPEQWTKSIAMEAPKPKRRPSRKTAHSIMTEGQSEAQSEIDPPDQILSGDELGTISCARSSRGDREQQQQEQQNQTMNEFRILDSGMKNHCSAGSHHLPDDEATAALQKAFQSSPPRFPGSKHSPIDLDADASPEPTRRLLFPSPRRLGEAKVLDGPSVQYTSRLDTSTFKPSINVLENEDKENLPPATDADENHFDRLLDGSEPLDSPRSLQMHTEAPAALKTPVRSCKRQVLTPSKFLSPTARIVDSHATPSRNSVAGLEIEQMTPFTAQLTKLISEANCGEGNTEDRGFSLGLGSDGEMFNFHDFAAAEIGTFSSPGNSSQGLFLLYEDPAESAEAIWNEHFLDTSINDFLDEKDGDDKQSSEVALAIEE